MDPSKWSSMLIVLPCFISVIAAVLLTWITYQILKLRKRLTLTEQTIRDQSVQQPVQQPAARGMHCTLLSLTRTHICTHTRTPARRTHTHNHTPINTYILYIYIYIGVCV